MPKYFLHYALLFAFISTLFLNSCDKMEFADGNTDLPKYSTDTIRFDTVFTTLGSAIRIFKIYNPYDKFLKIQKIELGQSFFRLNVDGLPGNSFENIEIRPKDSLYVFVEVTVNPDMPVSQSPFIILDSLNLLVNNVAQKIYLEAWGQNANYFPAKSNQGQISLLDLQGTTLVLDNTLPNIFYGVVYFDNGKLQIPKGTKIYVYGGITKAKNSANETFFYNDGRIIIGKNASIEVNGTYAEPVIFQGVRLEKSYENIRGQWSGIAIDQESKGNIFEFTLIKNNLVGIYVDSLAECVLKNCIIKNNTYSGIIGSSANIQAENCLFYNQGQESIAMSTGGVGKFEYCTFANYGNDKPAVFLSNNRCEDFPTCLDIRRNDLYSEFSNCIIAGSNEDELDLDSLDGAKFDLKFKNCIFKIKDLLGVKKYPFFISTYTNDCIQILNSDKLFKDISKDDFHLDTLSVANGKALVLPRIMTDLELKARDAVNPDMGCYEYLQ